MQQHCKKQTCGIDDGYTSVGFLKANRQMLKQVDEEKQRRLRQNNNINRNIEIM